MSHNDLLITRDWPLDPNNPKSPVLRRRRDRALANLANYQQDLDMITTLVGPNKNICILDVACGTGFRVLELANRGYCSAGLEIDPNLCDLADAAAGCFGLGARMFCGDACHIPVDSGSFDVVVSSNFFEHVYDVDSALYEQVRVLRKGGLLIVEDGNLLNPALVFDLLFLYPKRTQGEFGGLKWLLTKSQVKENLYGYLPLGRDEDVKTLWWWRRKLERLPNLQVVESTTTEKYVKGWLPVWLSPFRGSCLAVARKVTDD